MEARICDICKTEKPLPKFKSRINKDGSEWRSRKCRECAPKNHSYLIRMPFEVDGEWFKVCSKCESAKKLSEFAVDKSISFGTTSTCKLCVRAWHRAHSLKKSPKLVIVYKDTKICEECGIEKPLPKFKSRINKDGSERRSRKCRECAQKKHTYPKRMPFQLNGEWFKVCSKCKSEKNLSEFTLDKRNKLGVAACCRICFTAWQRARKPLKPKKPVIIYQDVKVCIKCNEEKPLFSFKKDKKKHSVWYDTKCTSCQNNSPFSTYRPYQKKGVWVKFCVGCQTTKPVENFVKKIKSYGSCKICNLRRSLAYTARKKGAKLSLKFTKADIIKRDGLICYLCSKKLTEKTATIEHLIPLSRGGNHTPENVKLACSSCNSSKNNKTVTEFKKWRGDYKRFQIKN